MATEYVSVSDLRKWIKTKRSFAKESIKALKKSNAILSNIPEKIYGFQSHLAILDDLEYEITAKRRVP